jgi:hypothetical protein
MTPFAIIPISSTSYLGRPNLWVRKVVMLRLHFLALVCLILTNSGCRTRLHVETHLDQALFRSEALDPQNTTDSSRNETLLDNSGLREMYYEVLAKESSRNARSQASSARGLLKSSVIKKLIRNQVDGEPLYISPNEIREFGGSLVQSADRFYSDPSVQERVNQDFVNAKPSLERLTFAYMNAYFQGEFVDRRGIRVLPPQLSPSADDDSLVGFTTVALEAFFDFAYDEPVYFDIPSPINTRSNLSTNVNSSPLGSWMKPSVNTNLTFFTRNNLIPSAARFVRCIPLRKTEIGQNTLRAVMFLSDLAGERSKDQSSLLAPFYKHSSLDALFNKPHRASNPEAMNRVIRTFCEVVTRRSVQRLAMTHALAAASGNEAKLPFDTFVENLDLLRRQ